MKRLFVSVLALSIAASPFVGCSKKEDAATAPKSDSSGTAAFVADPLLSKLPSATELFYFVNASGSAYKRFNQSPWAQTSSGLSSLQDAINQMTASGADPSQIAGLQIVVSTLQNLGLLSADGKSAVDQVLSKAVFFAGVTNDTKQPVEVGMYLSSAPGASLKSKLPILRQLLGDADLIVAEQKIAGVDGLVARPPQQPEGSPQEIALYLAATDSLMAISLTQSGAESLFSSANTDTIKRMSETPEFKKAAGAVGVTPDSLAFGYVDVKKLVPVLEKAAADNGATAEDQKQIREIPIDSIAIAQSYDKQIVSALGVAVSSRSDIQTKFLAALEGASIPASLAKLPTDTAFAIGIDTSFIAKLTDFLASIQDPDDAAMLQQVKDFRGVTLGLGIGDTSTSGANSQTLPLDVYLVVNADNREKLVAAAEAMVDAQIPGGGAGASLWSPTDIDGTPTKFIQTGAPVDIYLGSPKNSDAIVIASSERAIRKVLQASAGRQGGIADSLQATLKDSLSPSKLASIYFNGIKTASLLDSMKETIEGMTGMPSAELDQTLNTERLRQLGMATGSVSYSNGLFLIESAFDSTAGAN